MSYRNLEVWQRAKDLAVLIYKITDTFPESEKFGTSSQLRRAAISVGANIAEGYGRNSPNAYAQHLRIAKGSLNEVEAILLICTELEFVIEANAPMNEITKLGSMLTNLIAKIRASSTINESLSEYESDHIRIVTDTNPSKSEQNRTKPNQPEQTLTNPNNPSPQSNKETKKHGSKNTTL